jgi:hypothetical protein
MRSCGGTGVVVAVRFPWLRGGPPRVLTVQPFLISRSSELVTTGDSKLKSERRGLLWMAADVITFVITSPVMASVWKRLNSQYFTACFRDQIGRQRRITSKETDQQKAQRFADEYENASRTKRSLRQAQAVSSGLELHETLGYGHFPWSVPACEGDHP